MNARGAMNVSAEKLELLTEALRLSGLPLNFWGDLTEGLPDQLFRWAD